MAEVFPVLLEVVAPVFALILAGWLAAARRWIGREGFAGLNAFAFSLAAPALLFAAGTAGHAAGGGAALAFFAGCAVLYAAVLLGARRAGLPLAEAGAMALNTTFGNTVMMGIPLILAAFGPQGLAVLLAILALHASLLLGTATVVAEIARASGASARRIVGNTLLGILRNPIVMAVLLALAWNALAWPVPAALRRTLELLGAAAPPVSLFCLGASLAGFAARGLRARTASAVVLKLVVLPLLVLGFCRLFGLGPVETAVAVTTAALPTGANAFLLAQRYAAGQEGAGAAVLVSTAASLVTLSALLSFLR